MRHISASPARWTIIRGIRQLLTLQGDAGLRRGPALARLQVIPNAAVLVRNDVIDSVGPAYRIENLAGARQATEIDARGKIILPAFVETDGAILHNGSEEISDMPHCFRTSSRRKLTWTGIANSAEYARHGTLSTGLTALYGEDLRTTLKILQTFQVLQGKPLRIRPVISSCFLRRPGADKFETRIGEQIAEKWLPVIKQRKLASIIEIDSPDEGLDAESEDARSLALAAANLQFALRIRAQRNFCSAIVELAANAGATSFLTWPRAELLEAHALLRSNTVIAFPAVVDPDDSDPECGARFVRPLIDKGAAIAISMGPAAGNDFTRNMQHALHVACRNLKMTLEEAIVAATINAAYSLRTAHTTGSLEPGKSADLLVMDVPDYRELGRRPGMSNVEITMRAGQVVYRRPPLILD